VPIDAIAVLGDRYALEEVIGRGGMADVYRGRDLVLGRPVAVKLLRNVTADESERARFTAEARTLARLNHVGLVTVLDAGTTADQPYLVMELIEGPSLAECCTGTALDLPQVASLGTQVADALAYAHAAGVVHRDVKPGNVMLGAGGRVWLTDFGIARLIGDTARHTATGTTIGSPAYLSPEQVTGSEVTTAADIYSLGLVLLEALTGQRAYAGSPAEAALARLSTPPAISETLPPGWQHLLQATTALEPTERPSAKEIADTLRGFSADHDSTMVSTTPSENGETKVLSVPASTAGPFAGQTTHVLRDARTPWPLPSGKRMWWLSAALVLLLLVVLTAVMSQRNPGGTDDLPSGVPPRLEEPLQDLHDAVNGRAE
jgi:serine/threonine protein kinase